MNSRVNNAEEPISDLEGKIIKITQSEQQTGKQILKPGSKIWDLWENKKCANLCLIGVPEGEEKEKVFKMYLKTLWLKISQT